MIGDGGGGPAATSGGSAPGAVISAVAGAVGGLDALGSDVVRITLSIDGVDDVLTPESVSIVEALSEPFRAEVRVVSLNTALDVSTWLGSEVLLTLLHAGGERELHGIVVSARMQGASTHSGRYELVIAPRLWLLGLRQDSRVFQQKSAVDIVTEVLEGAGVEDVETRLSGSYEPRDYCVQYRETDFAFVERLLEEEGIYYFFVHEQDKHTMVLVDDIVHHDLLPFETATVNSSGTAGGSDPFISQLGVQHEIRPGKSTLRDYAFKEPDTDLTSEAEGQDHTDLEVYDFPGEYVEGELGATLSQVRLEELQSPREVVDGTSDLHDLCPGFLMNVEGAPLEVLDREYLVTQVVHQATQSGPDGAGGDGYDNSFVVVPTDRPYRPPRVTPTPRIDGLQTAVVTGPPSEEIHVDEYGRIKVQFHWDRLGERDDNSSCWIRVARGWAGASWGHVFHPRIGQEVIVQFLEGDPDRPVVTGSLYNDTHMPPYELPADKTKSTIKTRSTPDDDGSNEIRFEDKKGSEELYLHAQKDHSLAVENDSSTTVGHDKTVSVTNDYNVTVSEGNYSHTVTKGDASSTVTKGTSTTTVKGDTSTTVQSGNYSVTVSAGTGTIDCNAGFTATTPADALVNADTNATVHGGATAKITSPDISILGDSTITADAPTISVNGSEVTITGSSKITLDGGGSTVVIDASGVTVNGAKISLTGSAEVEVNGALITATASGVHTIKGATVKLN